MGSVQDLLENLSKDIPVVDGFVPRPRMRPRGLTAADACKSAADRILASVPVRFRDCAEREEAAKRMKFDPALIVTIAARILAGEIDTVALVGASGVGKTTAAALLVGEMARIVVARERVGVCHHVFW